MTEKVNVMVFAGPKGCQLEVGPVGPMNFYWGYFPKQYPIPPPKFRTQPYLGKGKKNKPQKLEDVLGGTWGRSITRPGSRGASASKNMFLVGFPYETLGHHEDEFWLTCQANWNSSWSTQSWVLFATSPSVTVTFSAILKYLNVCWLFFWKLLLVILVLGTF